MLASLTAVAAALATLLAWLATPEAAVAALLAMLLASLGMRPLAKSGTCASVNLNCGTTKINQLAIALFPNRENTNALTVKVMIPAVISCSLQSISKLKTVQQISAAANASDTPTLAQSFSLSIVTWV